jgi:hypothetical protein
MCWLKPARKIFNCFGGWTKSTPFALKQSSGFMFGFSGLQRFYLSHFALFCIYLSEIV